MTGVEYLCDQCKNAEEGSLVNNGHRERCVLCAGAESFDGYGNQSEYFRGGGRPGSRLPLIDVAVDLHESTRHCLSTIRVTLDEGLAVPSVDD